ISSTGGCSMTRQVLCCTFFSLTLTLFAGAQTGSKNTGRGSTTTPPIQTMPRPNMNQPGVLLSGKVVLGDGSQLTESAAIQTICKNQRRTETYPDSHGNFSFTFGGRAVTVSPMGGGMGDASISGDTNPELATSLDDWRECELQAVLPGFTSDVVELRTRM